MAPNFSKIITRKNAFIAAGVITLAWILKNKKNARSSDIQGFVRFVHL